MKKILVLGSNSFAGAVFVNECLNANLNVIGVNRSPEQHSAFLPVKVNSRLSDYEFHQMNINEDQDALQNLISNFKPNIVVWMDTIKKSKYPRINRIFKKPKNYDIRVTSKNANLWSYAVVDKVLGYKWNEKFKIYNDFRNEEQCY